MPFDLAGWRMLADAGVQRVFAYETSDTSTEVLLPGYFPAKLNIRKGDRISVEASDIVADLTMTIDFRGVVSGTIASAEGATAAATAVVQAAFNGASNINDLSVATDAAPFLVAAPVLSGHTARKADVDAATITLPHSNSITGRSIPSTVTSVFVQGFSAQGDGGESGPWVVVATQPTHTAWRQSADLRFWELQTWTINPRMFGAKGAGATETTQITNMFGYAYVKFTGNFGDQFLQQPAIYWPAGRWKAPGLAFDSDKTNLTMYGVGHASLLDGLMVNVSGWRCSFHDFCMADSRGITAGSYGLKLNNNSRRFATIHNVHIRDRYTGIWNTGGASGGLANIVVEKCTIGLIGTGIGDVTYSDVKIIGNKVGFFNYGVGEQKFIGCQITQNDYDVVLEGDNRVNTLESYYTNCTFSNATLNLSYPVKRVIDNGSGGARLVFWDDLALSSVSAFSSANSTRFIRGQIYRPSEALITVSTSTGTISSLLANGVEMLSATINWTGSATGAAAIVVAINANTATHGFSAINVNGAIYVSGPGPFDGSAQNGWVLAWTTSAGTITGRSLVLVQTTNPHGFVARDEAQFTSSGGGLNGIAQVVSVESTTSFLVEGAFTSFIAGTVTKALRIFAGERTLVTSGFTGITGYNQTSMFPLATGPGYVDIGNSAGTAVAFTGDDATGSLTVSNFELIIRSYDTSGRVNDQFVNCGNINKVLVIGGFHISFIAQRTKDVLWVDTPAFPGLAANAIEKIGMLFGRNAGNTRLQLPAGSATGWSAIGHYDPVNLLIPLPSTGTGGPAMVAPYTAGGLLNGKAATLNYSLVLPDRIALSVGGTETAIGFAGMRLAAATFAELTSKYPAASYNGWTLRITDRANRFATSDGTAWRDATGAVMT